MRQKKWIAALLTLSFLVTGIGLAGDISMRKVDAAGGVWVMTKSYPVYYPGKYVSRQNQDYWYNLSYKGLTKDQYYSFLVSGGFHDPGKPPKNSQADFYHECKAPADSVAAGGTISLTMQKYINKITESHGKADMDACIKDYDSSKDGDKYINSNNIAYFRDADGNSTYLDENPGSSYCTGDIAPMKITVTAKMPEDRQIGDTVGVIFRVNTAYDSYGTEAKDNYGGCMYYVWQYTLKDKAAATVKKPGRATIKKLGLRKKDKALIVYVKPMSQNVHGYQYQVSLNKNFKKATTRSTTLTHTQFMGLKKGKTYYVRIRAYNQDVTGKTVARGQWSKVKSIKLTW